MQPPSPNALPAPSLRELCRTYNIKLKKGLGQNLLLDDNINRILVDAAGLEATDTVIEVGPGLGALTRRILAKAGHLLSVEIDASFVACLEDQFGACANFKLFRGDILNHEIEDLIEEFVPGGTRYKMVSNVPYYITTPILFHFLESKTHFERMVMMVQDEVGQRLTAAVGAEDYGILAVVTRLYAENDIVHHVPASCFVPRPKVDSCVVRLRLRPEPLAGDLTPFTVRVIRAAFAQRRKTLRNALTKSGTFGAPKEAVLAGLDAAGIDGGRRAQTLHVDEFIALAQEIRSRMDDSTEQQSGE